MNSYELIASQMGHAQGGPSAINLLHEHLNTTRKLRLNAFIEYCARRGVQLVVEDVMNMLSADNTFMFTESTDSKGRFWNVSLCSDAHIPFEKAVHMMAEGYVPAGMQGGPYGEDGNVNPAQKTSPYDGEQGGMLGISETGGSEQDTGNDFHRRAVQIVTDEINSGERKCESREDFVSAIESVQKSLADLSTTQYRVKSNQL